MPSTYSTFQSGDPHDSQPQLILTAHPMKGVVTPAAPARLLPPRLVGFTPPVVAGPNTQNTGYTA